MHSHEILRAFIVKTNTRPGNMKAAGDVTILDEQGLNTLKRMGKTWWVFGLECRDCKKIFHHKLEDITYNNHRRRIVEMITFLLCPTCKGTDLICRSWNKPKLYGP